MSDTVGVTAPSVSDSGIRTYRKRRRMTEARRASLAQNARFLIDPDAGSLDLVLDLNRIFGRLAPRVLDIGFGHGESTLAMAAANPHIDVLAIDVHTPGVAGLLRGLAAAGTRNVRVVEGDVLPFMDRLAARSFARVQVLFPDPWPKTRHHRRRLVSAPFVARVTDLLSAGGILHVATDSVSYAASAGRAIAAETRLEATRPGHSDRPRTRFETRAHLAGRAVHELTATRR